MKCSMNPSLLALSLAVALGTATAAVHAADTASTPATATAAGASAGNDVSADLRHKPPFKTQNLGAVDVSAALDDARNALSPIPEAAST